MSGPGRGRAPAAPIMGGFHGISPLTVPDTSGRLLVTGSHGAGFSLSDGWDLSGLTLRELWLGYLTIGGSAGPDQLRDWARGAARPGSHQHNLIAQAINEHFIDRGEDHPVSYRDLPSLP